VTILATSKFGQATIWATYDDHLFVWSGDHTGHVYVGSEGAYTASIHLTPAERWSERGTERGTGSVGSSPPRRLVFSAVVTHLIPSCTPLEHPLLPLSYILNTPLKHPQYIPDIPLMPPQYTPKHVPNTPLVHA